MREATEKQILFACDIADELGIDLPDEKTSKAYHDFISENEGEYYRARSQRMGYASAAEDRFYKRMRGKI